MISKIIMPQGGQDLTTGRIVQWLKKENDPVKSGEVICEVETEKAVFEVSAPKDGYLLKIVAVDGQEVGILSVIGYVGDKGEKIPVDDSVIQKGQSTLIQEKIPDSIISQNNNVSKRRPKLIISPKARKLAKDHHIPLNSLKSQRPDSKITTDDVFSFIQRSRVSFDGETAAIENAKVVHPGKMRKTAAKRLTQSWQSTPHIFVTVSVDMTMALRVRMDQQKKKYTINDLVIRACALALQKYPEVNVTFNDENTIYYWDDINIGVASATNEGLMVPVINDADLLTLEEIAARSKEIMEKARDGKQVLSKPSRFTISNLGMHHVDSFTAVINPPEAAILAVASIRKCPVISDDGQMVARDMMNLTLSLDHRVGDGLLAAEFINEIKRLLEDPDNLIK